MPVTIATACRACGSLDLAPVLSLGSTPLANALVKPEDAGREEAVYPLDVIFCGACGLVQVKESAPREVIFSADYPYFSSFSDTVVRNATELTKRLIEERGLGPESLVVEVASNDGYLLHSYVEAGIPVLGIDPVPALVRTAMDRGVDSLCAFFDERLARDLREQGRRADALHANNVLAHVPNPNGFAEGIRLLLKDDGVAVIEVAYLRNMVECCEFDTIYHEHFSYFSLTAMRRLLCKHGLFVNDVECIPIHGGSLRVFASLRPGASPPVAALLAEESARGMDGPAYYQRFGERVTALRESLRHLLEDIKDLGGRTAAYGAAAKGSTLLNYACIGRETIDYVVDRNPHKQGKLMPGSHLPIYDPSRLLEDMPTHLLLLSWNFADEIMEQQAEYYRRGGRFIVPVPEPRVI